MKQRMDSRYTQECGTNQENTGFHTVRLKDLLKKGIIVEDAASFGSSIFEDVYARAAEAVERIKSDSRQERGLHRCGEAIGRNKEVSNIVSFIGRRGTGKSSSMLSFQEALKKYRGPEKDYNPAGLSFSKEADMDDVRFFVLDCIDAAALEECESVFTLVLANILAKVREYNEREGKEAGSYRMRSLIQKLEELYKNYKSLLSNHGEEKEYSPYEYLNNSASSQRIRTKFGDLVSECLQYFLEYYHEPVKEAFLVITIDDLDMAHYNEQITGSRQVNMRSYEIMREISKYFSVPGVIMLAAYNHINLQRQCSGFFMGSNSYYYQLQNDDAGVLQSGEKLTGEFMDKVFAPAYRLYMPSWKKRDYLERNMRIDIGEEPDPGDLLDRFRMEGRYVFSARDFLLMLYAVKTGVYYDCEGKKRHFLEADSLRALNSVLHILIGNNVLEKNNQLYLCQENDEEAFHRIMDDAYFRFINERLYLEWERNLFHELLERQIDRRCRRVVQIVAPKTEPLGRDYKWTIRHLQEERATATVDHISNIDQQISSARDNSGVEYSYAELLHCIYHMTRQDGILSKEFVACLLHSSSLCMTQIYRRCRIIKSDIGKETFISRYRYRMPVKKQDGWEPASGACTEPAGTGKQNDQFCILKKMWHQRSGSSQKEENQEERMFSQLEDDTQIFRNIIGKTVSGFWTQYFYPVVKLYVGKNEIEASPGSFHDIRGAEFKGQFFIWDIHEETDYIDFPECSSSDDTSRMLDEIVFLMSMYQDLLQWEKLDVSFSSSKNKKGFQINMEYTKEIHFELTAFVKMVILYPDYLRKMEQLLTEAFWPGPEEKDEEMAAFRRRVCEKTGKYFEKLWNAYLEWDLAYGNMILPVHNLDLMYNLVKHLYVECREQNDSIKVDDRVFFMKFSAMLRRFLEHLDRVDEFYCLKGTESFVERFQQCPFIRLYGTLQNDLSSKMVIEEYMYYIIEAVYNRFSMQKTPDEQ